MKIYGEKSIADFDFWSGAADNAAMLKIKELDKIDAILDTLYPEGLSKTQLNDLFWFDFEWLCKLIGLEYDAQSDEIIRE